MRRSDAFANIDRIDDVIRLAGRAFIGVFFQSGAELRADEFQLAIDILLRWHRAGGIGDDRTHVGQGLVPGTAERHHLNGCDIGGPADIVAVDGGLQETAPGPRLGLQPPVDDQAGDEIGHQALIVGDRVVLEAPGPRGDNADGGRQCRLHDHFGGTAIGNRIAEFGGRHGLALAFPVSEILFDQRLIGCRIAIAGNHHHGVFRPIPAIMKSLQLARRSLLQGRHRADRCAVGQSLPLEIQLPRGVAEFHRSAVIFAQFGLHDLLFRPHRLGVDARILDHAGQDGHAFVQHGWRRIGQIELIDGLRGGSAGVAVRSEQHTKTLPDAFVLAVGHMGGSAETQMFDQMGIAELIVPLMQRAGVHPDTDRGLIGRHAVMFHGIAQAIVELAERPAGVDGDFAIFIKPGGACFLGRFRGPIDRRGRLRDQRNRHQGGGQQDGERGGAQRGSHGALVDMMRLTGE